MFNVRKLYKELLQKSAVRTLLKILMFLVIILILYLLARELIGNVDAITNLSKSVGILGPIVLILLISLGILFTPIPNIVLVVVAGYLYGPWLGALYSYIGHLFAATGTFFVVRKFHINFNSKRYERYKDLIEKKRRILYLLYLAPVIPISVISIISAFSRIRGIQFLKIISVSFLPLILIFSFFGNRLSGRNFLEISVWALIIFIIGVIGFEIIHRKIKQRNGKN